jgi:sugar phosphate isomerase/epimerase
MRIGIDGRKIPQAASRGPIGSLDHARDMGMDGVFFRTVLDMSPTLDPGELAEIRAHADELGMYVESGLGKVNPYASPETPELRAAGDGDVVLGFRRMMQAAAAIDCRELWVGTANYKRMYYGRFAYDRFRTDVSWSDQLAAIARFLHVLAPIARDLGIHLNLETHEEITSFEVVRLVEQVGPDVTGIVFDTGNVLQRVEHPVRAAHRVAPYVRQTHIKDAVLCHEGSAIGYQMRPCGTGVIDFAALLTVIAAANPEVNLTLETDKSHDDDPPGTVPLDMYIELYESEFLDAHPDLTVTEFAEYVQLIHACDERIRSGQIPGRAEYASRPFGYAESVRYAMDSRAHIAEVCEATGLPLISSAAVPSQKTGLATPA